MKTLDDWAMCVASGYLANSSLRTSDPKAMTKDIFRLAELMQEESRKRAEAHNNKVAERYADEGKGDE